MGYQVVIDKAGQPHTRDLTADCLAGTQVSQSGILTANIHSFHPCLVLVLARTCLVFCHFIFDPEITEVHKENIC